VRRHPLIWLAIAGLVGASCQLGSLGIVPGGSGDVPPLLIDVSTSAGTERQFVPASVRVPVGVPIRLVFRNASSESHNLSFTGALEPVRTRTIMDAGEHDELTMAAPPPGTYRFVCTIHEGMTGELRVGDM
jgi:plastocyanin